MGPVQNNQTTSGFILGEEENSQMTKLSSSDSDVPATPFEIPKHASEFAAATCSEASDLLERLLGRTRRLMAGTKTSHQEGPVFLKDPDGLTPADWRLCLSPAYNSPLDLKYLYRTQVRKGIVLHRWKEWSQGSAFDFHAGSLIYDRPLHGLTTWGEQLAVMEFYVEVESAKPAIPANGSGEGRDPGAMTLKFYEPRGLKAIVTDRKEVTQDQFVRFAITGKFNG